MVDGALLLQQPLVVLILQQLRVHPHPRVGRLYRVVQPVQPVVHVAGLLPAPCLPHQLLQRLQPQHAGSGDGHLVAGSRLSQSQRLCHPALQHGQFHTRRRQVVDERLEVHLPEERVGPLRHHPRRVGIAQTDKDLAQVGQGRIIVPLLEGVAPHQCCCLEEGVVRIGIMPREVVVVAQVVIVDELVGVRHLRQQAARALPPLAAAVVVAHEGIDGADAQHDGRPQVVVRPERV